MADVVNEIAGDVFDGVSVNIRVCVGTARPSLQDLLAIDADTVLSLDRGVSDDVELYVGERLLARGVLEEAGEDAPGQLQVRILSVGPKK